jgi:hypothetical protein
MPEAQQDLLLKYYGARQGDGNGSQWWGTTNNDHVANDEGSDEEGKGGKGNDDGDEDGR